MPITHTSRTGKTYYLHTGPRRGGGTQHFFSTKASGPLAERLPEGFKCHETVNGQVYLRRHQPKVVRDEELESIRGRLPPPRGRHRYQIEVRGKIITIHESEGGFDPLREFTSHLTAQEQDRIAEQFTHFQPVMRFVLLDAARRIFAPERYCFRGSVDDWIPIGPPCPLETLAARHLKHLGRESFYDLH